MKFESLKARQRAVIGIIALILVAMVIALFQSKDKQVSHSFSGNVKSFDQNSMTVRGVYKIEDEQESTTASADVKIVITHSTKINKETVKWPAVGGDKENQIDMSSIKTETSAGSLDEMKSDKIQGLPVIVTAKKNVLNKAEFEAESIKYSIMVYEDAK
jgi:hypothetical protein